MNAVFAAMGVMIACGFLNRFRGGGYGAATLPGHPRYYVAPLFGLIASAFYAPLISTAIAAAYLLFVLPGWGRWYTGNRMPRELSGPPTRFEVFIERISDYGGQRRDRLAFFLRNTIVLVPGLAIVFYAAGVSVSFVLIAPAAAALVVVAYDVAWMVAPDRAEITVAEWLVGMMIGAIIAWESLL